MMRPKILIAAVVSILAFEFVAPSSFAGTETHGGQTISDRGQVWLRDLAKGADCQWLTGREFSTYITSYPSLLTWMFNPNYYFGLLLFKEEGRLRVCLTDHSLKSIPEPDQEIFLPFDHQGQQVAIRAHFDGDSIDTIFINRPLFNSMTLEMRGFLWLHEQLHGLIRKEASLRLIRLRSLVKYIYDHTRQESNDWCGGPVMDKMEFGFQLKAAEIDFSGINEALIASILRNEHSVARLIADSGADVNTSGAFLQALALGQPKMIQKLMDLVKMDSLNAAPAQLFNELYAGCMVENNLKLFGWDSSDLGLAKIPHTMAAASVLTLSCQFVGSSIEEVQTHAQFVKARLDLLMPQLKGSLELGLRLKEDKQAPVRSLVEALVLLGRPEIAQYLAEKVNLGQDAKSRLKYELKLIISKASIEHERSRYQALLSSLL